MAGLAWLGLVLLGLACFASLAVAWLYLLNWLGLFYNDSYHDSYEFLIIAYWLMFEAYQAYKAYLVIP